MEVTEIKYFVEAALLAAARPLSLDQLRALFDDKSAPDKAQLREALTALQADYEPRGIEVAEVASGYRMQVKSTMADRLERLWEERPPRYSRALFETLALIAYRQPMTRGEIEEIRGVSVSANIMRSLLEREWVRVVGHRDVPGRPAMFGTTRQFLDYFGLKKLDDLPPLADLSDWESLRVQLNLPDVDADVDADSEAQPDETEAGGSGGGAVVTPLHIAGRDPGAEEAAGPEADGADDEPLVESAVEPPPAAALVEDGAVQSANEPTTEAGAQQGDAATSDEEEADYRDRGDSSASSA